MDNTILIEKLIQHNCIQLGTFELKNGKNSKYYFNIKNIISYPKLLAFIGDEMYKNLPEFDIICGVPYGGLPIATYISTTYNKPMIIVRDKQKEYGMKKLIEGEYKSTDRCVIIEDVITSGQSVENIYNILKEELNIVKISVVVNRQQHEMDNINYLVCQNDLIKYFINKYTNEKKTTICFSADICDPYLLLNILSLIGDFILICKLHMDIVDLSKYNGDFIKDILRLSVEKKFLIMEDRKFVDISYIVNKQYSKYKNWVDLITVHGSCHKDVVKYISGVVLVANMSNNNFNYNDKCIEIAKEYNNNVIGFVTQERINVDNMICMTPGISLTTNNIDDQRYRTINDIDTDIVIIGRAIYNSADYVDTIKKFLAIN